MQGRLYEKTGPIKFAAICKTPVLAPPTRPTGSNAAVNDRLYLGTVEVGNSAGAAASCGFGYELPDAMWKAGQWDDSETASYVDDTTDAQSTTANDFPISTTTVNDGFVVQALCPFNSIGITISVAITANGSAPEYTYWNGAWTALTILNTPDFANTGDTYINFLRPVDWTPLAAADAPVATDGLSTGYYAVRVRMITAAPSAACRATELWASRLLDYVESVDDGKSIVFNAQGEIIIPYRASLIAYCSTANAANWINIEYRLGA
jgi:hypothetical protein